jgi:hypothetical protein
LASPSPTAIARLFSTRMMLGSLEMKSTSVVMSTSSTVGSSPAAAIGLGKTPSARSGKLSPVRILSASVGVGTRRRISPSTMTTVPSPPVAVVLTPLTGSIAETITCPTLKLSSTPMSGALSPMTATVGSLVLHTTSERMFSVLPSSKPARARMRGLLPST